MANQHFLPASYIGRFSLATDLPSRKRLIWVQRIGRAPYQASAEYVGSARRLYDRDKPNEHLGETVDNHWRYESRLPIALDALTERARPLDGIIWAQVLVPFIAAVFVRGPDFERRYESRIPGVTGPAPDGFSIPIESWHDNSLSGGQTEWQRLLAPVMSAKWTVIHGSGNSVLSTNDVAHCLMHSGSAGTEGYAFPLDKSTVLVLQRQSVRRILDWDGVKWLALVEHRDASDDNLVSCVQAIKNSAFKEVYGPTKESVEFAGTDFRPSIGPTGPEHLIPMVRPRGLIPYAWDYFRVLTAVERDPLRLLEWDGLPDWSTVAKSWSASPEYFLNLPIFPGGISLMHAYRPAGCQDGVRTSHVAVSSLYLDLTRFSADDVDRYRGKAELEDLSEQGSPALQQLQKEEMPGLLS